MHRAGRVDGPRRNRRRRARQDGGVAGGVIFGGDVLRRHPTAANEKNHADD